MTDKQVQMLFGLGMNVLFIVPYVWIIVAGSAGQEAPDWLALPVLVWGFLGFRWIARNLLGGTFMHVPVGFGRFFLVYGIGSVLCAAFGILIIPVLMIYQVAQLLRRSTTT